MRKGILAFALSLLAASSLYASGFHIYEFGGRASAMGGAVVARAWDSSTAFYNPAGIAFVDGTRFYGGVTLIFPKGKFVGAAPVFDATVQNNVENVFTPIGLYFTHKFNDKLAAGISVTNPFGLGVEWKDDFPGRFISRNVILESFYISPVLAYKLSPKFSVGVGLDVVISKITLERNVTLFGSTGSVGYEVGEATLKGTSDPAIGFSLSAMYKGDKLGAGFLYRHSVENKFKDGDATFNIYNNLSVPNAGAIASQLLKSQKLNTAITYPNFFSVGAYYEFTPKFGAEVDYMWFNWSVFDEIALEFEDARLNQTIPEDYENSWQIRIGAHYEATDKLSLRAGYIYDKTPQPIESVSPLLPDNTRNDYSLGFGYNFGKYQLDAGYMFVDIGERSTVEDGVGKNHNNFNGTYTSQANLFYASFGITF